MISTSRVCGVNYHETSIESSIVRVLMRSAAAFLGKFSRVAKQRTRVARSERRQEGALPLTLRWVAPVTYQARAARLEPARRRPSVNLLVLDSHGRLGKGASELVRDEHVGRCAS